MPLLSRIRCTFSPTHVSVCVCACVSATVFYVARETRQPDFQLLCERRLFNEFIACWDSVTHTPRIRRRQAARQAGKDMRPLLVLF